MTGILPTPVVIVRCLCSPMVLLGEYKPESTSEASSKSCKSLTSTSLRIKSKDILEVFASYARSHCAYTFSYVSDVFPYPHRSLGRRLFRKLPLSEQVAEIIGKTAENLLLRCTIRPSSCPSNNECSSNPPHPVISSNLSLHHQGGGGQGNQRGGRQTP